MFSRADEYRRRAVAAKQHARDAQTRGAQEAFELSAAHWLALAHQLELLERGGHVRLFRPKEKRE